MPILNALTREINCKIVYYGTGLGGKTTNLQYIHSQLAPTARGELISLATASERTLFFDFLPLDLGSIGGWAVRFSLYTVPGQVEYNASRKMVLVGADALIFVADSGSTRSTHNVESFVNMEENLNEHGKSIRSMPLVLQYNKRDLRDAMPLERLERELNQTNVPSFASVASEGLGVFATLRAASKLLLQDLSNLLEK